jgi:hypothetical protein
LEDEPNDLFHPVDETEVDEDDVEQAISDGRNWIALPIADDHADDDAADVAEQGIVIPVRHREVTPELEAEWRRKARRNAQQRMYQLHRQNLAGRTRNVLHRITRPTRTTRPNVAHRAAGSQRRVTSTSAGGDPPQGDDPPPSAPPSDSGVSSTGDTDLNIVWRGALDRFETIREYQTLAELAHRRAARLEGRWAA